MTDLQEAFREAARREFAMVPSESEIHWEFSPRFQRRMRRIIRAQAHGYWNFVNTTAKRVACVAVIIMMLLTTAMAIKPVRDRVIKFFVEVYEDYFEIRFGEIEKNDIDPTPAPMIRYTLSWMPDDYVEVNHIESNNLLWTYWSDDAGNNISLKQEPGTQEVVLDNKDIEPLRIEYGNLNLNYYTYDGGTCIVWEQYGYVFNLTVYENLPMNIIMDMISSLKSLNNF